MYSTGLYVEFKTGITNDDGDDGGEFTYSLSGTPYSFQLQARYNDDPTIQVDLISMPNTARRTIDLGFYHDGDTYWTVVGDTNQGFVFSNDTGPNWMRQHLSLTGSRTLRDLTLPGSHDAGIWSLDGGSTFWATERNTVTQTKTIAEQLAYGARWFDIRPTLYKGVYGAGHWSNTSVGPVYIGWEGGNGEALGFIIVDIQNFVANNPGELIIVSLTHDLDADASVGLNQAQWNQVLQFWTVLGDYLYDAGGDTTTDLTTLPIIDFGVRPTKSKVLVLLGDPRDETVTWGSYEGHGFYSMSKQFPLADRYSDKQDPSDVAPDQIAKLYQNRTSPASPMFLLSWTITLDTASTISQVESILDIAPDMNQRLGATLLPAITTQVFPNILLIDDFASTNAPLFAAAINYYNAIIPFVGNLAAAYAPFYYQCGGELQDIYVPFC